MKNRFSKSIRWGLGLFLFVAIFADFLANEKPLFCKIEGEVHFPVLKDYAVQFGLSKWDSKFIREGWYNQNYEFVFPCPIPYSPTTLDRRNTGFKSPFDEQNISAWYQRHWLGTDNLGRDVSSGMIHGTRTALFVAFFSMLLASIIGILLGALAGYYGDDKFSMSVGMLLSWIIGGVLAVFYGFVSRAYVLSEAVGIGEYFKSILIFIIVLLLFWGIGKMLERLAILKKAFTFPWDAMVMRSIEIFNSIPFLFVLLALLAILSSKSIWSVTIIIGFLAWTRIARFVRASFIKIRNFEYMKAAEGLGFSDFRKMFIHALPNALGPVLITIAFGMSAAILAEATLSFLGIGVAYNNFGWGNMLNIARSNFSAWWLVLFPGLGILGSILLFNKIADNLSDGKF